MALSKEVHHLATVISHRAGGLASALIGLVALFGGISSLTTGDVLYGITGIVVGVILLGFGWWALKKGTEHHENAQKADEGDE